MTVAFGTSPPALTIGTLVLLLVLLIPAVLTGPLRTQHTDTLDAVTRLPGR